MTCKVSTEKTSVSLTEITVTVTEHLFSLRFLTVLFIYDFRNFHYNVPLRKSFFICVYSVFYRTSVLILFVPSQGKFFRYYFTEYVFYNFPFPFHYSTHKTLVFQFNDAPTTSQRLFLFFFQFFIYWDVSNKSFCLIQSTIEAFNYKPFYLSLFLRVVFDVFQPC